MNDSGPKIVFQNILYFEWCRSWGDTIWWRKPMFKATHLLVTNVEFNSRTPQESTELNEFWIGFTSSISIIKVSFKIFLVLKGIWEQSKTSSNQITKAFRSHQVVSIVSLWNKIFTSLKFVWAISYSLYVVISQRQWVIIFNYIFN